MNTAPIYDLAARRAAQPRDRRAIIDNIDAGVTALLAQVSGWPVTFLRESHLIGAERSLVALQGLLIELREFVPVDSKESA